jgi:hypothetical protein
MKKRAITAAMHKRKIATAKRIHKAAIELETLSKRIRKI